MPLYIATVNVALRPSVLDPAGEATKSAALRLGIKGINKLRIGKAISIEIEATKEEEARSKLELLTDRLLSNPVIEDWNLQIEEI